jgi:hypothetical protein
MGVPITFLDKYNPDQFEIIALGNSVANFTPNKKYINPKKHVNNSIVSGEAINCVLSIETENIPNEIFYTSDNSKYLIAPYARVLIQRKQSDIDRVKKQKEEQEKEDEEIRKRLGI